MTVLPLVVDWGHTWLVTGVGFGMVFVLLVVLIFILKLLGVVMNSSTGKPAKNAEVPKAAAATAAAPKASASEDDDMAAVAMALHLYFGGVHDEEPTEITLKNIERRYSPWNDKAYGMNNLHR